MDNLRIINIGDYAFILRMVKTKDDFDAVASSSFLLCSNNDRDMTKKELEHGRIIQRDIYDGKYNHLIPKKSNVGEEIK